MLVIFNILYYIYIFLTSNTFKIRNENHTKLQNALYNNIDNDLVMHISRTDIVEDNKHLYQIYEKINNWAYNGTESENDTRAGNINNIDDLLNKRFKMLITGIMAVKNDSSKIKNAIFSEYNISKTSNTLKASMFLYSSNDVSNNILPPFTEFRNSNLFKTIIGPLPYMNKVGKCNENDARYFCNNSYKNNKYMLSEADITIIKQRYNQLKQDVKDYITQLKNTDSVMMYRLDVIIAFLSLIIYIFIIISFVLQFFKIDLIKLIGKDQEKTLQYIISIIINVIIICIVA